MKISVITAATRNYSSALRGSIMSVKRAMAGMDYTHIIATDRSGVADKIAKTCRINSKIIELDLDDTKLKYKQESQIIIASLQQACFDEAVALDSDICWSVESDIIVHQNSFHALKWLLDSPEPKYDVAVSTYWNGSFLCGRGTQKRNILEDFVEEERKIPDELKEKMEKKKKEFSELKEPPSKEMIDEMNELTEKIRECPPIGNIFELNSRKWRRRGWFENAYPGATVYGSVLPTDWCGMGCTMLSKRALNLSNFDGYDGAGTQDLYLVWHKWNQSGIRIGCNVSVPSVHIKKHKDPELPGLTAWVPYFNSAEEETCGHLRILHRPYFDLHYEQLVP